MPSPRNPTRRNRNIGTTKRGHGQDNKLVIPNSWWDSHVFWEKLGRHTRVTRTVDGRGFHFLVENTRRDCTHCCTVDDILCVIRHIPADDMAGLNVFVLRQPKRKEQILAPVWGRLIYEAEYGDWVGAVRLEAQNLAKPIRWSRSLDPETSRELDRLRLDGHRIVSTRREFHIEITLESARANQLYRTLLHEIGHRVDWLDSVKRRAARAKRPEQEFERLYFARPQSERENSAHHYADELAEQLRESGVIPFERQLSAESLEKDDLRLAEFVTAEGPA
jgi:hypothetical protein